MRTAFFSILLIFFSVLSLGAQRNPALELRYLIARTLLQEAGTLSQEDFEKGEALYRRLDRSPRSLESLHEFKYLLQFWRSYHGRTPWEGQAGGPRLLLPIRPDKPASYSFEQWSRIPELRLEAYDQNADTVLLAGLGLRSGDILITDRNAAAIDGLLSSFPKNAHVGAHMGMVIFLEKDGHRFPAVLEVVERGLRAVPLNTFLSREYNLYVEQFRLHQAPENWSVKLNQAARELMHAPRPYTLWLDEELEGGLTCSTVVLHLLRMSGAPVPGGRSVFPEGVARNLSQLGLDAPEVFTPTDLLSDAQFEMVGVLDHGEFQRNVIHELLALEIRELFASRPLVPGAFPFDFRINRWALEQMEVGSWLGRPIVWWYAFTPETLPRGPHDLMALYQAIEKHLIRGGRAALKCPSLLAGVRHQMNAELFSFKDFRSDPQVRQALEPFLAPIRKNLFGE